MYWSDFRSSNTHGTDNLPSATRSIHPRAVPLLGPPITSIFTYDIFERLAAQSRRERPTGQVDVSDYMDLTGKLPEYELGLVSFWERGQETRILGPVLRGLGQALWVQDRAFPRDFAPKRPWTIMERSREDNLIPEDRVHTYTEVVADGFRLHPWQGKCVACPLPFQSLCSLLCFSVALPFIDRVDLVMAVAVGVPQVAKRQELIGKATLVFDVAALLASPPPAGQYVSITWGIIYDEGSTVSEFD